MNTTNWSLYGTTYGAGSPECEGTGVTPTTVEEVDSLLKFVSLQKEPVASYTPLSMSFTTLIEHPQLLVEYIRVMQNISPLSQELHELRECLSMMYDYQVLPNGEAIPVDSVIADLVEYERELVEGM